MTQEDYDYEGDGWSDVIAPLAGLVDLDETARTHGALVRRRGVSDASSLLRLAFGWAVGGLSLRQKAAWARAMGVAKLCDSALLRRLRKSDAWLEMLVRAVLEQRAPAAEALGAEGRLIRLMDGSTFGARGATRPHWRLQAGYDLSAGLDLSAGQMGGLTLTPASQGEKLEKIAVTPGELRIADRGYARPDGLRHIKDGGGDFLLRLGARSLKMEHAPGEPCDLVEACEIASRDGVYDRDVFVVHGKKGRKTWPPLRARLIIKPLPPEAAEAARARLRRAGQRERYSPSRRTMAVAGHIVLITSLDRDADAADAESLLALYRLRWQVELAFKRLKSLVGMRDVPTKEPDLARTWLYSNLLVALLTEEFGADLGAFSP